MSAPTVRVELVEEKPCSPGLFVDEHPGWDIDDIRAEYTKYLNRFQPFRILITASNGEPLFRSTERYLRLEDARRAIEIAFAPTSNVWLRRVGHPDEQLRAAIE